MHEPRIRLAAALADRYRIERELGQGGMATVYLAQDLRHHRQVAIKLMRPELAAVIGAERFLSEIRTTANLQHPHILPLFDSGEADGVLYYAMPFVEGESLRDRLTREKQLPIADAVRIATEVASALDYAHRHGVIHRDIKPENILLHDGSALVADFGIALAASKAGGTRITETGMSVGTPHYMSPEQAMGEREITARSDIYALGAITYEMLIGEPPFSGPTAQAIVAKVLTEEPRPLIPRRRSIPAEVEEAVLTALEKLPADRFGSAHEFAASLTAEQTGRRTGARARRRPPRRLRPGAGGSRSRPAPRHSLAAGYLLGARRSHSAALPMTFGSSRQGDLGSRDGGAAGDLARRQDRRLRQRHAGPHAGLRPAGGRRPRHRAYRRHHPGPVASPLVARRQPGAVPRAGRRRERARHAAAPETAEVPPGRSGPVISAAWAPDGKRIAYVVGDSVFVREARGDSRGIARVFEAHGCAWSPDAEYLACSSGNAIALTPGTLFGNASPSRVVSVRVRDGRVVPLTDSLFANLSPVWSPDGRWVYYVSNRYGPRDIFAQAMAGGEPRGPALRLTTGLNAHTISLSADGRRIAYGDLAIESNAWSIADAGPSAGRRPSSAIQVTRGSQFVESSLLSRDGRWLYYDSDLSGNMDLYRMALPAGAPERLTSDSSDDFWPAPSPDGREVAFHSWRGGSRDIWVMPPRRRPAPAGDLLAGARRRWPPGRPTGIVSPTPSSAAEAASGRCAGPRGAPPGSSRSSGSAGGSSPPGRPTGGRWRSAARSPIGALWIMPADSGPPRLAGRHHRAPGGVGDGPSGATTAAPSTPGNADSTGTSFWRIPLDGGAPERLVAFEGGSGRRAGGARRRAGWPTPGRRSAATCG